MISVRGPHGHKTKVSLNRVRKVREDLPQSFQNPLNLSGAGSVYRTVCAILRCYCWIARVSWPSFASLYPQACRNMCGWTGKGRAALIPARATIFRRHFALELRERERLDPLLRRFIGIAPRARSTAHASVCRH